jgi:amino acid adenylation domain-containing protein
MKKTRFSQEQLALLAQHMGENNSKLSSIKPGAREAQDGHFPLSFAQQRLWFLDQLQPGSPAYTIAMAYRIKGAVNVAALEKSVNEIIRRHEILRTTFQTIDGQPVQVIVPALSVKFIIETLAEFPVEQREAEMQKRAVAEAREPFNLATGPLLRSRLFQLSEHEHVLLLTAHHIVFDGWSISVFNQELATLYETYIQEKPSPLPELPIQYADFAYWQREWLQGEVLDAELGYWKQQLSGAPSVLELPGDRPRPAVQTLQGGLYSFKLSKALSQALEVLNRRTGCTLFQTLLAAFQVLLYRYTGQVDIVIGSPIANRRHIEIEPLIGFFANTLVMRSDLSGNPTFLELLERVREMTLDAYTHQDLPFEKIVDELRPQRDLSYAPLIQVLFVLQNASDANLKLIDLDVQPLEINNRTAKFDLSLELVEAEDGLKGSIQYSVDLFNAATIVRMADHLQVLLEGIVATPSSHISNLPLLTISEYQQLLVTWNETQAEYDEQQGLHHLVETQARRTPEAWALVFEHERLTYRSLDEQATQLAHYLRAQGVGPEQLVGLALPRSLEMVIGLLAILKAGGICLPLDPEYPPERLAFMLQDAQASLLLTQESLLARFSSYPGTRICLESAWPAIREQPTTPGPWPFHPQQGASVVYTSGSTGTPKGVLLRHSSLCNRILWGQMTMPLTPADRVLQEASLSFDFALWELFAPLAVGAQVILARPGGQRDLEYLLDLVEEQGITVLHLIPSLLRVLLEQPDLQRCQSVRQVYGGAEALPTELWERYAHHMHAPFYNVYGPSEASIDSTCWRCEPGNQSALMPIGHPIGKVQVYLLDPFGQLVPVGVPGEIYLAGAGLARGYLHRADLTAERFVPHPFSVTGGERLYRTGDVARWRGDGSLEYLGRVDQQVKVRGFRVEPGEIEAVLAAHPAVRASVVVVREEQPGDKRLVAYVQPEPGRRLESGQLRQELQKKVPDYMLPNWFVVLDAFPMLPTGKIDRDRLPAPQAQDLRRSQHYVPPRTPAEEILAHIWAQVLGIERIGIHDNFFELGGDSIRSIRIIARAKEAGLQFSVQQLFRYQTIADLIESSKLSLESSEVLPHTKPFDLLSASDRRRMPADVEDAYPITALQAGMFYHMDMTMNLPGAPDYHNVDSYYYRAPFHLTTFQQAVTRCVQRHPALRTSFDLTSYSEPLQLVHRAADFTVQEEDIRHCTPEEQEQIIRRFVEEERNNRFDMSQPPLLRFHVHRRTDDSFQFTFTEYHPIIDGWSLHSILAEVFNDYFIMLNDKDPGEKEPLTTSFRDFVALEKMTLQSEACQRYWAGKLASCNRLELPKWTSSDLELEDQRYGKIAVSIPFDVCEGLRELARSNNVSLKSVLFAAHVKVMSLLSGQTDILTGQLSNGRLEVADGERVVGLFLNILPLRLELPGGTWLDLVRQAFEAECEMLPFRRYPLAEMQSRWGGRTPLLNTVFSYFDFHVFNDLFAAGQIEHLGFKITSHNVGFVLNALFFASAPERKSSQIFFDLAYETAKLSEHHARCVGEYYIAVMKAMLSNPLEHYGYTCVLPERETRRLLMEWNETQAEYDEQQGLHHLVETQARRTPEAWALVFEHERLTYRSLDEQATQLAHYLRAQGVGPEQLVGLALPRSLEMVIGLLAILKAGGICLPLDPEYPPERLAFMLQDAQASLLLTQESLLARFSSYPGTRICLESAWPAIREQPTTPGPWPFHPQQGASVVYTSGSTGTPKGVLLRHSSLCNRILWGQMTMPLTPADRVLQEASLSFDFALWELFAPLAVGAQVILARPGGQRDLEYLLDLVEEQGITVLHLIPSLLRVLLEQPDLQRCQSVRQVYGGAEALPTELWERYAHHMHAPFYNVYGPSEASIDSTCWRCEPGNQSALMPIGHPIGKVQVYLLDPFGQLVPVGVPGEIYLAGAGLARGYLHRADLTAERFVPHPFSVTGGERLYRTGDVARWRGDGSLEYLGRVDQQVKVRGFRVEPGEIEAVLAAHPAVRASVVVVREEQPGDKRLVAYVQPEPGRRLESGQLRQELQKKVPDYMLPNWFVVLDAFPMLPTGKIDRDRLPAPQAQDLRRSQHYVPPEGPLERMLTHLWENLLGQTHISTHDDFFDLGGDSLVVIQLVARLRAAFRIKIAPQDILEGAATIADLSDLVWHRLVEHLGSMASEQLLDELEQVSEEDAWILLLEKKALIPARQ